MGSNLTADDTVNTAPLRRAGWLKTLHRWHWVSSAMCLVGMLLFAFTGITLNHAADIEAKPAVERRQLQVPAALMAALRANSAEGSGAGDRKAPLPAPLRDWIAGALSVPLPDDSAEWSAEEVYLALPRPGGDAWLRIDRSDGALEYERTDRGWIAYLNDLHKARHTGPAWRWFVDLFAAACLVFSATGLLILHHHAAARPSAWPLVGFGLVLPLLLALLLIH